MANSSRKPPHTKLANGNPLVRASTDFPTNKTTPITIHGGGTGGGGGGQMELTERQRALTSVDLSMVPTTAITATTGRQKSATITVKFKMKSGKKKTRTQPQIKALTPTASVSDGYFSDTDQEEDERVPSGQKSADKFYDICKQVYKNSCNRLKLVPRHYFLKQIGQNHISLRDEGLSRKEINAISASLVSYQKLFTLDMSRNILTDRCTGYISQLLERNSFVTNLVLADCEICTEGLKNLVEVIPNLSALQTLDLSGNKFRDEAGPALSDLITNAQDITSLKLRHNELRETGGVYIGDALAKNEGLENLDLSWNHLRGKGAECVGLALLRNSTLTYLNLSWNGMGFEGCCALAHGLHDNTSLKELDLTCNRIHPPALFELLKGILCNKTLICLRLGRNPIPASLTSAILARFRDANEMALQTLDLSGIVVDKLFEVLLQEIKETRHFECIFERALAIHKEKSDDSQQLDTLHKGVLNIDPLRILYFIKKNLRIIDMFRQMDVDDSSKVSRDEVRRALLREDMPLSSSSLDAIMDYLDTNRDGEIDLLELLDGERRFKRQTLAEKHRWQSQERLAIEQAQEGGVAGDPGGQAARFSRSFRPDLVDLHATSKDNLESKHYKPPVNKNSEDILKLPKIDNNIPLTSRTESDNLTKGSKEDMPHTAR